MEKTVDFSVFEKVRLLSASTDEIGVKDGNWPHVIVVTGARFLHWEWLYGSDGKVIGAIYEDPVSCDVIYLKD